jgi:hypothetical protein
MPDFTLPVYVLQNVVLHLDCSFLGKYYPVSYYVERLGKGKGRGRPSSMT